MRPGLRPLLAGGGKRALGWLSWQRRRYAIHRAEMLDLSLQDVAMWQPDHRIVGGDLVNIALPGEFAAATDWLRRLGDPADVSLVPGNHDALVRVAPGQGMEPWRPWMTGDDGLPGFPWLRRRGPFALIGVSTAVPTPPFRATGRIGAAQMARLGAVLEATRGAIRTVVIHHPPILGHGGARKGLVDRAALCAVLQRHGAELVLHGHHHRFSVGAVAGIPVLGVPSASAMPVHGAQAAGWWRIRSDGPRGWSAEARQAQPRGGFATVRSVSSAA